MEKRKRTTFYLKTVVSIFLLYYVFRKVGWQDIWNELKHADLFFLTLYISLDFVMILVTSIKWSVLVKPHGINASLPRLFSLHMVGRFFNNILPTSVGGDVIRAYELGKCEGKKKEAMASVFMERFTGLTTLIVFALLAVSVDPRFQKEVKVVVPLAVAVVGYLGIVAVIFSRSLVSLLEERVPIKSVKRFIQKAQNVQASIYMYKHHRVEILYAMAYSILFYAGTVLIVYVGCLVFGVRVDLSSLCVAVPIMLVLFMIPISVGGIGLQEWAYYFVMGMVGVPSAVGLSLGLLYRGKAIAVGLLGGAIYPLVSSHEARTSESVIGHNPRSQLEK